MQDLIKTVSVENVLALRDAAAEAMRRAGQELAKAEEMLERISEDIGSARESSKPSIEAHAVNRNRGTQWQNPTDVEDAILAVDARIWDILMHRSGVAAVMSPSALEEWDALVRPRHGQWREGDERPPALTVENVYATFSALRAKSGEMAEDTIIEAIKTVSWDYKSNQPFKIGKKVIVEYAFSYGSFDYSAGRKLDALERAFCLAVGAEIPDHNTGGHGRQIPFGITRGEIDRKFWKLRWFKNRNIHLLMTDTDAVDAVNRIIAKHFPRALPPQS